MTPRYRLIQGDCLDILPTLEAQSVDAVICDPPYGTTACAWDSVIPFEPMWAGIKHVLKPRGAAVLFGSQPFTSALVMSNPKWFRYQWYYKKPKAANFIVANYRPLSVMEDVLVFSESSATFTKDKTKNMTYNPQKDTSRGAYVRKFNSTDAKFTKSSYSTKRGGFHDIGYFGDGEPRVYDGRYPTNFLEFGEESSEHPTQKPVALMEYLIRTYTNEGDTVLDFAMGSGTTGCAAVKNGRNFIGIEMDAGYFAIAEERIKNAAGEIILTARERATGQMGLFGGDV